ncbi:hypothetical protein FRC07_009899, partial [Ceratobasidium sp. 392]
MDTTTKEKGGLPLATEPRFYTTRSNRKYTYAALFASLLVLYPLSCVVTCHHGPSREVRATNVCPQVEPLSPSSSANRKLADELGAAFTDPSFEAVAAEYLGGAVRIPTESYDNLKPVGEDPRWDVFYNFSSHLLETFPNV